MHLHTFSWVVSYWVFDLYLKKSINQYNEQSGAHAEKKLMMKTIQLIRDHKG